jgi:hypothetical protein
MRARHPVKGEGGRTLSGGHPAWYALGVYYDSYWESLKFTPAEREAWRRVFPPETPDGFEIAPRTARRWADAGYSPEAARSTFAAAGVDHVQARQWKWTDPATAITWLRARFGPDEAGEWAKCFSLDEALRWRAAGFSANDAKDWSDIFGEEHPDAARAWAQAGFDVEDAYEAVREGVPLEVARMRLLEADAPIGKENGGSSRRRR